MKLKKPKPPRRHTLKAPRAHKPKKAKRQGKHDPEHLDQCEVCGRLLSPAEGRIKFGVTGQIFCGATCMLAGV